MAFIVETSHYLPDNVIENKDLVQFPEKYRDMIRQKAGVMARRHVVDECTSDLGARAVQQLIEKSGIDPLTVDALICATSSPDRMQPATATRIQELCGLKQAFAFDVNSVCSGGVYALKLASALIKDGLKHVIVVASEVYSKILNPKDIASFPYFGDGAGAVLVSHEGVYELADFVLYSDGSGADVIQVPAGGSMLPAATVQNSKKLYFTMLGAEVFKFACSKGSDVIQTLSERNHIVPDQVVTHQANINIIHEIAKRTMLPKELFFVNLENYANIAGASSIIALDECLANNDKKNHIFLVVFGGGLSWGGCYLKNTNCM